MGKLHKVQHGPKTAIKTKLMTHNSFAKIRVISLICLIVQTFMKRLRAKLNKAKTTGLLIGSLKHNSPKSNDIKWTKSAVKTSFSRI